MGQSITQETQDRHGGGSFVKLLFVEDEYYTRNGILQSIDWAGLGIDQVESASNGQAGMDMLRIEPDILLTDIRMPYVTGLDIAKQLKSNDPESEIIIMSSYSDKEYLFTAISLSAVSYIEKPVRVEELTSALRQAIHRRKQSLLLRKMQPSIPLTALPDQDAAGLRHSTRMALQLIREHYQDEQFNVNTIAEALHLTADHLTSSFKDDTGRTIKRVITDVRLEAARYLLLTTNLSMGEIAHKAGYDNANYFSKVFRQTTGVTPNEYRAQHKKAEAAP